MLALFISSCASKRGTVLRGSSSSPVSSGTSSHTAKNPTAGGKSLTGLAYIEQYSPIAIREMNQYGIPASIKLAQALLESGNGNSYLAKEANNHFGIKCGGVWNGKSVSRADDNPNDCFRVYGNAEESFKDHSQFLLRKRYEKLFMLDKDDYKGWAKGLKEAGYATNPRYPSLLIDLIERYELHRFDRAENQSQKVVREERVEALIEVKKEVETQVPEQIKSPVAMIIHEVKASETLFALSRQYGVTIEQIKTLNGLQTENLSLGQMLVISK